MAEPRDRRGHGFSRRVGWGGTAVTALGDRERDSGTCPAWLPTTEGITEESVADCTGSLISQLSADVGARAAIDSREYPHQGS